VRPYFERREGEGEEPGVAMKENGLASRTVPGVKGGGTLLLLLGE